MERLGEWEKGMKKSESEHEEVITDIWDDPAKRWEGVIHKPFKCAYEGYANRFNIKPGFRWDGVVRGNGFETQYLQSINTKKAEKDR
jgi:pre-mRNA-splicing factor CWC26